MRSHYPRSRYSIVPYSHSRPKINNILVVLSEILWEWRPKWTTTKRGKCVWLCFRRVPSIIVIVEKPPCRAVCSWCHDFSSGENLIRACYRVARCTDFFLSTFFALCRLMFPYDSRRHLRQRLSTRISREIRWWFVHFFFFCGGGDDAWLRFAVRLAWMPAIIDSLSVATSPASSSASRDLHSPLGKFNDPPLPARDSRVLLWQRMKAVRESGCRLHIRVFRLLDSLFLCSNSRWTAVRSVAYLEDLYVWLKV